MFNDIFSSIFQSTSTNQQSNIHHHFHHHYFHDKDDIGLEPPIIDSQTVESQSNPAADKIKTAFKNAFSMENFRPMFCDFKVEPNSIVDIVMKKISNRS